MKIILQFKIKSNQKIKSFWELIRIDYILVYCYSVNQFNCYILIIPAFGIISHIISAFARKPIFGQDGP